MNKKAKIELKIWMVLVAILLIMPITHASILDERTEQECVTLNDGSTNCLWTGYSTDKFQYYDGEYRTFDYMIQDAQIDTDKNLVFNFNDDNSITLKPFVIYNDNKYFIEELQNDIRNELNYGILLNRSRDGTKFDLNLVKMDNLDYIGIKLESSNNIETVEYNYTPEGVYDETNFVEYPMIDFIVNNRRISFKDIIESGYSITFDKDEKEVYIDLRNIPNGELTIDPATSFSLDSNDGHISFLGAACNNINDNGTTATMGEDFRASPVQTVKSYTSVNTSSIPDDATINFFRVRTYAHSFSKTKALDNVWDVTYQRSVNDSDLESLGCEDVSKFSGGTSMGTKDWAGTTGWKVKGNAVSFVNKTGWTSVRLGYSWTPLSSGQHKITDWRTTEYGSETPNYYINYSLPLDNNETEARQAIEEGINNTIVNGQTIHTDQQIYIIYLNGTQATGTFDKTVSKDNQTWGFNYITSGELFTNMLSLLNIVNIWENTSLEYNETVSQVEIFINSSLI